MLDRIFHDRLKKKLRHLFVFDIRVYIPFYCKVVIMHRQLDFQICFHISDTGLNGDHIFPFTQRSSVKSRKCKCHFADIHLSAANRHPVHHGQRIIQEMRIDLCLQCFQLILFQRDLIDIDLINQTVDLIHHPSEAVDQNTNLVFRITADCNLPASMVHLIHVSGKFFNLS